MALWKKCTLCQVMPGGNARTATSSDVTNNKVPVVSFGFLLCEPRQLCPSSGVLVGQMDGGPGPVLAVAGL